MNTLQVSARPLIFSSQRLVLTFSPKAACSHAILWFYLKERLMAAATYYSKWPHDFRNEVYYNSTRYKLRADALRNGNRKNWTLLRITRDPAKRLVSQFRHTVRYNIIDTEIKDLLDLNPRTDGISFDQFTEVLTQLPKTRPSATDTHLCAQKHPIWEAGFGRIITINADHMDVNASLNAVEREFDMHETHFDAHPQFLKLREIHYARPTDTVQSGKRDDYPWHKFKFTRKAVQEKGFFPKESLLPTATKIVPFLYPDDIGQIETGDTAHRLFQSETKINHSSQTKLSPQPARLSPNEVKQATHALAKAS